MQQPHIPDGQVHMQALPLQQPQPMPMGGMMPGGGMPGGGMPGYEMPGGGMPGYEMPGSEMPGGGMPLGGMPTDQQAQYMYYAGVRQTYCRHALCMKWHLYHLPISKQLTFQSSPILKLFGDGIDLLL